MSLKDFTEGQLRSIRNQTQKETMQLAKRIKALQIHYNSIDRNLQNTVVRT
jgi:hypothetical protein